ncbi:MAG TPA: DUF6364 family protein [Planctomycetota bacterium]|nr:DUF6364 family protein [Planctomycetota bacterium]
MRTTLRLDDQILREAKRIAAETGRTLAAVVEDLLREALARRRVPRKPSPVRLPTVRGRGLRPGINLDSGSKLLDWMEEGRGQLLQERSGPFR